MDLDGFFERQLPYTNLQKQLCKTIGRPVAALARTARPMQLGFYNLVLCFNCRIAQQIQASYEIRALFWAHCRGANLLSQ